MCVCVGGGRNRRERQEFRRSIASRGNTLRRKGVGSVGRMNKASVASQCRARVGGMVTWWGRKDGQGSPSSRL